MALFKEACLTCLNKNAGIYHDLHEILLGSYTVFQLLHKTMPMLFDRPNIPLPKIMCHKCSEKLVVSFKFHEQCSDSLQKLYKLGSEPNIIKEEEEEDLKPDVDYEEKSEKVEDMEEKCYFNDGSHKSYSTEARNINKGARYEEKLNNASEIKDNSDTDEYHNITSFRRFKTNNYSCKICHEIFKTYNVLQSHLSKNHSFNNPFECAYCEYRFKTRPQLLKHEKLHNENEPKRKSSLHCKECREAFKQPIDLANHIKEQHGGRALYECNICQDTFELEEQFKRHCNMHLGLKWYQCSQCPKAFDNKGCLNQHVIGHKKETSFLCPICGKSFNRSSGLKQHMRRHTNEKPFKCSYCDRSFKCGPARYSHTKTHSSEKLFECKICGLHFGRSGQLSMHENTHIGRKPYKCDFCEKSFTASWNLKTHRRVHTGEKPYECQHCNKTFAQSSTKNKHIRRMHKNEKPREVIKDNEDVEVQ